MSAAFDLHGAAARLVADLMPIAVAVAGDGADKMVAALAGAGAGAEVFAPGQTGFDLAILLTPPAGNHAAAGLVEALAACSDRLLFVPVPLGTRDVPDLDFWFEAFADHGFQPVVEYDATFLGQGAFLVDRNATAAETELAGFAERVSLSGSLAASAERVAALEAELGNAGDRAALKNALAERDAALAARGAELAARGAELAARGAELATARDELARAQAELDALRSQLGHWETVGHWVAAWVALPERNALAALRQSGGRLPKRSWFARWRKGAPPADAVERRLREEAALLRGSKLFDPVWYIAAHPELAASALDPVWHYLLHGAAAGADPGPFFDSAAYRQRHPDAQGNPLVHAIRSGADKEASASF
jgi:hypothetical protein